MDKDKKHNKKRTKTAQTSNMSTGTKRRVNITIDATVWDSLDELGIKNKSAFIEDYLKSQVKK